MAGLQIFNYPPPIYVPEGIKMNLTMKEARKEYARLRSIAVKRLKRFEGTEFTDTQIYQRNKDAFAPTSKLSDREVVFALTEVANFLQKKTSTVTGLRSARAQAISTLNRHGYDIRSSNFVSFGEYMQIAKTASIGRYFDSERAAELFVEYQDEESAIETSVKEFKEYEKEVIRKRARARRIRRESK